MRDENVGLWIYWTQKQKFRRNIILYINLYGSKNKNTLNLNQMARSENKMEI